MHRSGTSALSGAFNILGANHGSSIMPPAEDNPKGYWEHTKIVEIHDQLFEDMSLSWDSTGPLPANWLKLAACNDAKKKLISICKKDFSAPGVHCIKDPRMCRFLPLWGEICAELKLSACFAFILRSPEEVAGSIFERDGYSIERSLYLWALHIFDVVKFIVDKPNHVLTYENLLDNPAEEMVNLINSLNLAELAKVDEARLRKFVSRKLKHQSAQEGKLESAAVSAANSIYNLLTKNSSIIESPELSAIQDISLPLFMALDQQRNDIQGLLDSELDLADYIEKDKTILQSKLSSNLQESKDYASNLLSENEKLINYTQSLKETITELQQNIEEKDLYAADLEQTVAEKDLFISEEVGVLEADIEGKGKFIESLQSHLSASQEYASQLEDSVIKHAKKSEEYSQSLLESIREKDSQISTLTEHLKKVREQQKTIITGLVETLEGRKFVFPKTLSKIKSDLDSLLSSDDNEIEQGD